MKAQLKAELRKLFTIRSTYIVSIAVIALTMLFTYLNTSRVFIEPPSEAVSSQEAAGESKPDMTNPSAVQKEPQMTNDLPPEKMKLNIQDTVFSVSLLIAVVAILLMAHEYRYNTITYTLILTNSRTKVLAAKILVASGFTIGLTLLAILTAIAATYLAVDIKNLYLPPQQIDWLASLTQLCAYTLGFSLFGLALITLLRNLTAGIVGLFFLPTLELILAGFLSGKNIEPSKYLPFSALGRLGNIVDGGMAVSAMPSAAYAGLVFSSYLVALWLITWVLFLRRDAS